MSPFHTVTIEVDTRNGVKRRAMPGIKSAKIFGSHVKDLLTDAQINAYWHQGFYANRASYRREQKKIQDVRDVMPRLVYDCGKQDFIILP